MADSDDQGRIVHTADDADDKTDEQPDDAESADASVVIAGAAIKRHRELHSVVADEYAVDFAGKQITSELIDPANVLALGVTLDAGVAGEFPDDRALDCAVGLNDTVYGRAVSPAKKGSGNDTGDDVVLDYDADLRRLTATVSADRGDYNITHETEYKTLEPGSIRKSETPNLDLSAVARVDRSAFEEMFDRMTGDDAADHVHIEADGGDLLVGSERDKADESIRLEGAMIDGRNNDGALYSGSYLRDIYTAIKKTKPEKVTIRFGNEFPIEIECTFSELGLEATYTLAPRIKED